MSGELSGATSSMAHPHAYAFFVSFMLCVFAGFVTWVIAGSYFGQRESAIFSLGFVLGWLVFAWLVGAFDTEYGKASAGGFGLAVAGMALLFHRGEGKDV